jgi:hypothetical protein
MNCGKGYDNPQVPQEFKGKVLVFGSVVMVMNINYYLFYKVLRKNMSLLSVKIKTENASTKPDLVALTAMD